MMMQSLLLPPVELLAGHCFARPLVMQGLARGRYDAPAKHHSLVRLAAAGHDKAAGAATCLPDRVVRILINYAETRFAVALLAPVALRVLLSAAGRRQVVALERLI